METAESFETEVKMEVRDRKTKESILEKISVGKELRASKEAKMMFGDGETREFTAALIHPSTGMGSQHSVASVETIATMEDGHGEMRVYTVEKISFDIQPLGDQAPQNIVMKKVEKLQEPITKQTAAEKLEFQATAVDTKSVNNQTILEMKDEELTMKQTHSIFTKEELLATEIIDKDDKVDFTNGGGKEFTGEQTNVVITAAIEKTEEVEAAGGGMDKHVGDSQVRTGTSETVKNVQLDVGDGEMEKLGEQHTSVQIHVSPVFQCSIESVDQETLQCSMESVDQETRIDMEEGEVKAVALEITPVQVVPFQNTCQVMVTNKSLKERTQMNVRYEEVKESKLEQTPSLLLPTYWEKDEGRTSCHGSNMDETVCREADASEFQSTLTSKKCLEEFAEKLTASQMLLTPHTLSKNPTVGAWNGEIKKLTVEQSPTQVFLTEVEISQGIVSRKVGIKRKAQMEVPELIAEQTDTLVLSQTVGECQDRTACTVTTESAQKKVRTETESDEMSIFNVEQVSSTKHLSVDDNFHESAIIKESIIKEIGNDELKQFPVVQTATHVLPITGEKYHTSTASVESVKKKWRMEVGDGEVKVFTVDKMAEYQWPVNGGGEHLMIQEQVTEYLAVKSFKRKYPNLHRRPVETEEKTYLVENDLVLESMCDMGLTAVLSSEVLDVMYTDFQEKYEEYCSFVRDRQRRELNVKQKPTGGATNVDKNKQDYKAKAVSSAAKWNAMFNKARKDDRRCCFDLQTFTIHFPWNRRLKMIPKEVPRIGCYPLSLVPGQFQDGYKDYTPTELHYFPLNTVLYGPVKPNERKPLSRGSDGSQSDSTDSSSSDDSDSMSSEDADSTTSEETGAGDEQGEGKCSQDLDHTVIACEVRSGNRRTAGPISLTGSSTPLVPRVTGTKKKAKSVSVMSSRISHKVELNNKLELELKANFKKFSNRFSKIWLPETLK